ncbi:hypothetical protein BVRB_3g064550 [Beta vulgaris subsp. vulgaris]|nr:hypothetical protein BVRB_3g064550 [Beta vulgaris subsp. vulgaris]
MSTTTKMKYLYFISEEWRVLRGCTVHLIRRLTPVTKKHAPPSRVEFLHPLNTQIVYNYNFSSSTSTAAATSNLQKKKKNSVNYDQVLKKIGEFETQKQADLILEDDLPHLSIDSELVWP